MDLCGDEKMDISTDEIDNMLKDLESDDIKDTPIEESHTDFNLVEDKKDELITNTSEQQEEGIELTDSSNVLDFKCDQDVVMSESMHVDESNEETSVVTENKIEESIEVSGSIEKESLEDSKDIENIPESVQPQSDSIEDEEGLKEVQIEAVEAIEESPDEIKEQTGSIEEESLKEVQIESVEAVEESPEEIKEQKIVDSPQSIEATTSSIFEESPDEIKEQTIVEESTEDPQSIEAIPSSAVEESPEEIKEQTIEEATVDPQSIEATTSSAVEESPEEIKALSSETTAKVASGTPEDILNLLKLLSPEKLQEIKSKVLEITTESELAAEKSAKEETKEMEQPIEKPTEKADDVICIDSDDEQPQEPAQAAAVVEPVKEKETIENKQKPDKEEVVKKKPKLKECVNSECPRNLDDDYQECPVFVMNLYYVNRKSNRIQWICSTCFNDAMETYEQLCTNVNSNIPWTSVKIPKKQDLVEIIDSDDEDEPAEKKKDIPQSEMYVFNEETEAMVEDVLKEIANRVDIKGQFDSEFRVIEQKAAKNEKALNEMNEQLKVVEKKSQVMYDALYSINRPKIERRPSLHIDVQFSTTQTDVKTLMQNVPKTNLTRVIQATPQIFETNAFAVRHRVSHWIPCKFLEEIKVGDAKRYKVQFNDSIGNNIIQLSGKELAHDKISETLEIGTRVIARFPRVYPRQRQSNLGPQMRYLPGVIGEKLTKYNDRRYLVFCDYGQVKYCPPSEVRAVCESSENVWEDVHKNLSPFIKDYLVSRREVNRSRAMLTLEVGHKVLVEQSSDWRQAIVLEVDRSLAKISFAHNKSTEWLYRGSKRLHPIYMQASKSQNSTQRSAFRRDPGITYIAIDDDDSNNSSSDAMKKNIAKKSTTTPLEKESPQIAAAPQVSSTRQPTILNDDQIYLEDPANVGKVRHFTPKQSIKPNIYKKHTCGESCLPTQQNNLSSFSPLAKPLLACWERQIVKQKNTRFVVYKAPCGRRLRNMREIFNYLRVTKSFLNVDNFDLDATTQVLATYTVQQNLCGFYNDDCTEKKEGMKIPVVNAFDNVQPPPLEYSSKRIPMPGVNINTDPEFMSCCDCTDDCVDKSKCACFQLTIQGAKYMKLMEGEDDDISYIWKRLLKNVPTGIYECNSRCKCSDRCLNKLVQKPIAVKMMLFRTKKRGWGLKTIHDIPKGTFICIYAGNLYTDKDANALCHGQDHGDEYFAELDLIEVVENMKEGFEPGVTYPDSDDEKADSDSDYDDHKDKNDCDDGDFVSKSKASGHREILTRSSKMSIHSNGSRKNSSETSSVQRTNSDDSSDNDVPTVNMIPAANTRIPLRKLYGPKEKGYIMDAKKCGNVGRYFNHSCDPNLFVQNVFVDTHDLRFPWIAFFTSRAIKASEELTWNYQYEIGSVPTKVLYCHCGSKNCVGRIL